MTHHGRDIVALVAVTLVCLVALFVLPADSELLGRLATAALAAIVFIVRGGLAPEGGRAKRGATPTDAALVTWASGEVLGQLLGSLM